MKSREIVLMLMKEHGISQTEMAKLAGFSSPASLRSRLVRCGEENPGDLSVETLLRLLDALGYDLIIREKGKKRCIEYTVSK